MRVLVLNCGSSSLKYCRARVEDAGSPVPSVQVEEAGTIEGIGGTARWTPRTGSFAPGDPARLVPDHGAAVRWLAEERRGLAVDAVGHRLVHGGPRFSRPVRLDADVTAELERLSVLAPLHNPPAIMAVRASRAWLGAGVPMVAAFDTAFHRDLPEVAARYALPRSVADRHGVRRYGFHGIAHASMARQYAECLDAPVDAARLITVQLGRGCSMAAVRNGRSVDTSMGFTPLEGLVMGTRSGDLDPSLVGYLSAREGWDLCGVERVLNEESGLLGVSGLSADMPVLLAAAERGDRHAALAIELFCYRVTKYLGAYLAVLSGADAVLFGGGIGERAPAVRARICRGMEWCGLVLDETRNRHVTQAPAGEPVAISADASQIGVYVVGVDEEREIAQDTWRVLSHRSGEADRVVD